MLKNNSKIQTKVQITIVSDMKKAPGSPKISTTRFTWQRYLSDTNSNAAPVECFKHSPCYDYALHVKPGTVVEILNPDYRFAFWFGKIINQAGLKIELEYIGCPKMKIWLNATDIFPMGYCLSENKKAAKLKKSKTNATFREPKLPNEIKLVDNDFYLVPPKELLETTHPRDIEKLVMSLANYPTLPDDYHMKISPDLSIDYTCFEKNILKFQN